MNNSTTLYVLGHKVTPHETTGDFNLVYGESPAGAQGPPPHFHNTFDEVFFVTQGEMEFMINGEITTIFPGESVNIPLGALHTFNNRSDNPCSWVNVHAPKGFLSFFETFGIPVTDDNAFEKSIAPQMIKEVLERAGEFDMVMQLEPQPKQD